MSDRTTLYVVGADDHANRVLTLAINRYVPIRLSLASHLLSAATPRQALWLLDLTTLPQELLGRLLRMTTPSRKRHVRIALANAVLSSKLGPLFAYPQVCGLLQPGTPPEGMARGIEAMWEGELWLPRRVLSDYLRTLQRFGTRSPTHLSALTNKEREILFYMAQGNTNNEIAAALHLSVHTVRTHIYNLFRKLSVENRTQATNWANAHLDMLPPSLTGTRDDPNGGR